VNTSGKCDSAFADCSSTRPTTVPPTTNRRADSADDAALLLARTTFRNVLAIDEEVDDVVDNACIDLQ
jgi:hypothetical protein